jgi:hypothetical protein
MLWQLCSWHTQIRMGCPKWLLLDSKQKSFTHRVKRVGQYHFWTSGLPMNGVLTYSRGMRWQISAVMIVSAAGKVEHHHVASWDMRPWRWHEVAQDGQAQTSHEWRKWRGSLPECLDCSERFSSLVRWQTVTRFLSTANKYVFMFHSSSKWVQGTRLIPLPKDWNECCITTHTWHADHRSTLVEFTLHKSSYSPDNL